MKTLTMNPDLRGTSGAAKLERSWYGTNSSRAPRTPHLNENALRRHHLAFQ